MNLPVLRIGGLQPQYPIIQGGMAVRVSTAPLAAAVANEGGIGIIAATGMSCDELRQEIREAKRLSGGIIGINIMFAARLFAELVWTAIEEKIDLICSGAGFSRNLFNWGKESGVPIVSIVSSAKLASAAEKCGAAAVVAEGAEAGGHLGTDRSIKDILPEIRRAVSIPVIAAGGVVDGKGMARMFRLGADGVQMATRFVLSTECTVAQAFKDWYLKARAEDVVVISSPVGLPGRALINSFVDRILRKEAPSPEQCNDCLKHCSHEFCILKALNEARAGNIDQAVVFTGQNVHQIKEILPVKRIFEELLREVSLEPA